MVKGLKLSLFDVSDVSDPKEVDTYITGDRNSNSAAIHDHKAFLFSKDKNLLVIPVTQNQYEIFAEIAEIDCIDCIAPRSPRKKTNFRGAMVFSVNSKGFELKGEIEHADGTEGNNYWHGGYNYYDTTVRRSLYIDDVLYTFSNKYLKMNDLDDLSLIKDLELEKNGGDGDFDVVN